MKIDEIKESLKHNEKNQYEEFGLFQLQRSLFVALAALEKYQNKKNWWDINDVIGQEMDSDYEKILDVFQKGDDGPDLSNKAIDHIHKLLCGSESAIDRFKRHNIEPEHSDSKDRDFDFITGKRISDET